jgi:hypothetical protein
LVMIIRNALAIMSLCWTIQVSPLSSGRCLPERWTPGRPVEMMRVPGAQFSSSYEDTFALLGSLDRCAVLLTGE